MDEQHFGGRAMDAVDPAPPARFERYTGDVYGWAYRVLGHHHDALDVVQDVFIRWDAQCAAEAPAQPRGWLRRVTLNRAIDLRRRRQSGREAEGAPVGKPAASGATRAGRAADGRSGEPAETPAPIDAIDRETLRSDVSMALGGLTDVQRGVLVAKVYDEMSFSQIAAEHRLAVSTVKTHYVRALRRVRDRLAPRWGREEP